MNVCVVVGKVLSKPNNKRENSSSNNYQILMETTRPFKMSDGSYKKDIFPVTLWKGLADEVNDSVNVGDILCVKGRMESECKKIGDEDQFYTSIIAEKLTFLQTRDCTPQITF